MDSELFRSTSTIFAIAAWLALHRVALNRGFVLKRRGMSTDTIFILITGFSATIWTLRFLIFNSPDDPLSTASVLTRAAHAPMLIQLLFVFWTLSWIDAIRERRHGYDKFTFWKLAATSGPFDWRGSVNPVAFQTFSAVVALVISISSISAILDGYKTQGVLSLIGLTIFFFSGTRDNPYVQARHRYQGDMLRISLATNHHEGTIYILPSAGNGFDAVWSPKVKDENNEADHFAMNLFRSMRSEKWLLKEPLECVRSIVSSYQERVVMASEELEALAKWLYLDTSESADTMRPIRCMRAKDIHLIGRDLMYALCHAEYLVFMGQGRLSREMQQKLGTLRLMKRSGASLSSSPSDTDCIGYKPGFDGYHEAVEYVYALFNEPLDQDAVAFSCAPPKYSKALSKSPRSIDEYVEELWNTCCDHSESTFTALYMFTLVWSIELGNCNGFHLFPLRCKNREGDLVSHQIVWRQAWYSGVICQLLSVSSLLFAAFVGGYLQ